MATAVKDAELDTMKSTTTTRGLCPRCQKRSTKGFINLTVTAYGTEKSARGAKHIKSKGRSMCGTCIKEVYRRLNRLFDEEVNG